MPRAEFRAFCRFSTTKLWLLPSLGEIMKASEMLHKCTMSMNQIPMQSKKLTCISFSHLGLLQHSDSMLDNWVRE